MLADDLATLVWLANLAAVELHTPLARSEDMQRPTSMVFDLDPGAPATVIECCRVALTLHGTFERLGLQSFAKTSGSKGLQVYVPLNRPDADYQRTKTFARTVAELLEQSDPELVVSRMTKSRRAGKVLIDWSQNDARKTTVCVYSLRAIEGPGASTPVTWDEVSGALDEVDPARLAFTPDRCSSGSAGWGTCSPGCCRSCSRCRTREGPQEKSGSCHHGITSGSPALTLSGKLAGRFSRNAVMPSTASPD